MYDITPIVEAVFALVAAIITAIIIPYIKSRTTAQQQELWAWVKIAVNAAEQLYKEPKQGKKKKEYVLSWLAQHGITVDADKLDALIEAAVHEMNAVKPTGEVKGAEA